QLNPDVLGRQRQGLASRSTRASEMLTGAIEVELGGTVRRVAVERRWYDASGRGDEVGGGCLGKRRPVDRERERPSQLHVAQPRVQVVEADVRQPRQRLVAAYTAP